MTVFKAQAGHYQGFGLNPADAICTMLSRVTVPVRLLPPVTFSTVEVRPRSLELLEIVR